VAAEFRATSGGSLVTYVTILNTESTATFFYYDEKAGVWTITADDGLLSAMTVLTVGLADVDHFDVSATSPQTAGTPFDVTITAVDLYGNMKTDYVPAGLYVWETTASDAPDGTAPAMGELVEGDFVNGVAVNPVTLYCAEAGVTFIATDVYGIKGTSGPITVDITEAIHLDVYGILDPVTAGMASGVTVEALDAYDNRATSYLGTIQFTSSDTGTATILPGDYTFMAGDAGIKVFADGVILTKAGEHWVKATDASITGEQSDITVEPADAVKLLILVPGEALRPGTETGKAGTPDTQTAGESFLITVVSTDEYWNKDPTGVATVDITTTDPNDIEPAQADLVNGVTSISVTFVTSGVWTITGTDIDGDPLTEYTSSAIPVDPADAVKLQILVPGETAAPGTATGKTGSSTAQEVGQPFDVVVNAVDEYWNINPAGMATVDVTTTDLDAIEPAQADLVDGTKTFTVTFKTMGVSMITATDIDSDPLLPDTSPPINVNPGPATHLHVYGITDPVTAGVASGLTVEARDEFDNVATGYIGTIQFTSSDTGTATILPGDYTFMAGDAGIKVFADGVILTKAGEQWVSATDIAYIEYSYSADIDIEGSDSDLVLTVIDDGDYVTWTFDFPVEEFTGDGNLNVGLIIALDGEGEGPAFQIHNTDSNDMTFLDGTPVEAGTWAMSPWGTIDDDEGWNGWHGDMNTLVTDLDWVEASGNRNVPHEDGVLQIKIDRAVLGSEFHWAASPTVGSGFWDAGDVTMQVPTAFGWSTPIVDMTVPNYVHRSSIWGEQIEITVEPAVPAYVDVIASSAGEEGSSISVLVGGEAMITATVTDAFGNLVPETEVSFETKPIGTVYPLTDKTDNGVAQTSLLSQEIGIATVTADVGDVSGFCTVTFVKQTLEIELSLGWNLISVPRTLADPAIGNVFAGITTIEKVYTYEDSVWYYAFYEGNWDTTTIDYVEDGKGYWVYASAPTTITIILDPLGYWYAPPPDYPLPEEWSLIGYTSLQMKPDMSINGYLDPLDWNALYRYNPTVRMYEEAKPSNREDFNCFELGKGYWIYLNEAGKLIP